MADEIIIDATKEPEGTKSPTVSEDRINQLSDKVKTTADERDAATAKATEAERRAMFAEGFADIVATQPAAKDHKEEIKEKVSKGYSVQDATYAVLGAAGKLGSASQEQAQVAGGSAATAMPQGGAKAPSEMTQAERRASLAKDLGWS